MQAPNTHARDGCWVLHLSRYERDNLLWLLNLVGGGMKGVYPFTLANNGDWLGQITWQLGENPDWRIEKRANPHDAEETGKPNGSREAIEKALTSSKPEEES